MLYFKLFFIGLFLVACSKNRNPQSVQIESLKKEEELIVLGAQFTQDSLLEMEQRGLEISGQNDVIIIRASEDSKNFSIPVRENYRIFKNEKVEVDFPHSLGRIDYLAKEEFGLGTWIQERGLSDGRGVTVGVLDDGLSLHQSGLLVTSEGKRKIIKKFAASSALKLQLSNELPSDFDASEVPRGEKKFAELNESSFTTKVDFNFNSKSDVIGIVAIKEEERFFVCVDSNVDKKWSSSECSETFEKTGQYLFWDMERRYSFATEVSPDFTKVTVSAPEYGSDSHGEGVASVMAGFKIGGKFDGMAPGAQIIDYDLSSVTSSFEEEVYSLKTFVEAFDYLAQNGAEVVNISYSLFFHSAAAQRAMGETLDYFVKEKNLVFSFSAGNNGPGLMSMNRRQIYPEYSLVVAAHAPKKLDEVVHGVSGLPEEGRVIFYSSRGPDATSAEGATVLGVLSNLVHSTSERGMSAFSGTSSAAPSVGGVAAVLISALKQHNLPVNAATVVEALRLSGKRLKQAAFIEQGYGHPQIEKAFSIYKELISGKRFMKLSTTLSLDEGEDEGSTRGIFIRLSHGLGDWEKRVQIKAIPSELVPVSMRGEILDELLFEYSHPFITGPVALWASIGGSRFNLRVSPPANLRPFEEILAEVRIRDKESGDIIHIIPVTIVNDLPLNKTEVFRGTIETQDAKRFHFSFDQNIKGVLAKLYSLTGRSGALVVDHYNSSGVRSSLGSNVKVENGAIFPNRTNSLNQFTIANYHGSDRAAEYALALTPLKFKVLTTDLYPTARILEWRSNESLIGTKLVIRNKDRLLDSSTHTIGEQLSIQRELTITEKGSYKVALRTRARANFTYPVSSCKLTIKHADGTIKVSEGSEIKYEKDESATLAVLCFPFESGVSEDQKVHFILDITNQAPGEISLAKNVSVGINEWSLTESDYAGLSPGEKNLWLQGPQIDNSLLIGTLNFWN